jgi:DNA-binding NarL/FixJ family response regulator
MEPRGPFPPTRKELQALAAVVRFNGYAPAAHELHIGMCGIRERLRRLYARLGVTSTTEALVAVGWLAVPEEYVA